jgi:hypothetical protein
MKLMSLALALLVGTIVMAQSPIKETVAYSRSTIGGVPVNQSAGSSPNPLPVTYLIYIVVKKGTPVVVSGVCVQGRSYNATLKRVETPVEIESDVAVPTDKKDILVGKTSDDAYQVEVGQAKAADCKEYGKDKLAQQGGVVVYLKSDETRWYGQTERIVPLRPGYAM